MMKYVPIKNYKFGKPTIQKTDANFMTKIKSSLFSPWQSFEFAVLITLAGNVSNGIANGEGGYGDPGSWVFEFFLFFIFVYGLAISIRCFLVLVQYFINLFKCKDNK